MGKINMEKAYLDSPELRQQLIDGHDRIKQINSKAYKFSSLLGKITKNIEELGNQFTDFAYEVNELLNFEKENFFNLDDRPDKQTSSAFQSFKKSSRGTLAVSSADSLLNSVSKLNQCMKNVQEQQLIVERMKNDVLTPLNAFHLQVDQLDHVKSQVEIQRLNYEVLLDKYCTLSRKKDERKLFPKEHLSKISNAQNDYFCSLISYMSKVNMMNRQEGLYVLSKSNSFVSLFLQWSTQSTSTILICHQAVNEAHERCHHIEAEKPVEDLELFMNLNLTKLPKFEPEEHENFLILNERGYKHGYLRFRPRGRKDWKRKYFYIQRPEGLLMSVELNESAIMIADIKTSMIQQSDVDDRYNTFQIVCSPHPTISLQAETEKDLNEWMRTFRAIQLSDTSGDLNIGHLSQEWSAEIDELMSQSQNSTTPTNITNTPMLMNSIFKETELLSMNVGCCEFKSQKWKGKAATIVASGYMKLSTPPSEKKEEPVAVFKITDIPMELIIPVHHSLFDRKHVLCIKYNNRIYYLKCEDAEKYNKMTYWLKYFAFKPRNELIGSELIPVRYLRHVFIKLLDGRYFTNKNDFYCTVSVDNILLARTCSITNNSDCIIREDFKFEEFPTLNFGITISVYDTNPNRFNKDQRYGRVFIRANKLKSEKEQEEYYQLISGEDKDEDYTKVGNIGEIRIRWKYQEIKVLPIAKYSQLLTLMNSYDIDLLKNLYKNAFDLEPLSHNLLQIYQAQNKEIEWFFYLIECETRQIESNTLFRGNSILTKALEIYLKQLCFDYLDSCVGGFVKMLVENDIYLEVDPTRVDKPDTLQHNWSQLIGYTETLWMKLFQTRKTIPTKLIVVLQFVKDKSTEKLKDEDSKYLSVSAFFFLRLICPALLSPKVFNLTRTHPSPNCQRTLTLIAKSLQSLANLSLLGIKEQYMHPMNAFIESKFSDMKQFLTDISTTQGALRPSTLYINDTVHTYDLENQLALFHHFVTNYENNLMNKELLVICSSISNLTDSTQ